MAWKKKKTQEDLTELDEEVKNEVKPKIEEKEMVVNELPQLPQRKIRGDDGNIYNLTTSSEAIQELLENTREILEKISE